MSSSSIWHLFDGLKHPADGLYARMKSLIIFTLYVSLILTINFISNKFGAVWNLEILTPIAILSLPLEYFFGFFLTALTTISAFIFALFIGHFLGIVASLFYNSEIGPIEIIGVAISKIFDFFYIVPIVVTVGLFFGVLQSTYASSPGDFPRFAVAALLFVFAALILGGYQIFESIYRSNVSSPVRHQILVDSLYINTPFGFRLPLGISELLVKIIRRRDVSIQGYAAAVIRAFHLALVSTVIVEAVIPSIYEYTLPNPGQFERWYGGVGQLVLNAQSDGGYDVIAGLIWLLFIFDVAVVMILELVLRWRYLAHYRRQ